MNKKQRIMSDFKKVSEQELKQFIKQYPNKVDEY